MSANLTAVVKTNETTVWDSVFTAFVSTYEKALYSAFNYTIKTAFCSAISTAFVSAHQNPLCATI